MHYFVQELVELACNQKVQLKNKDHYIRDLENYIDNLLVRVMETTPRILQNPYEKPRRNSGSHITGKPVPVKDAKHTPLMNPVFVPCAPAKKVAQNPLKRIQSALK